MAKSTALFRRFRWRRIIVATCFLFGLLIVCSLFFPSLLKHAGDGLLFFPEKLKIVQRVHRAEIAVLLLKAGENSTGQLSPGRYYIYTDSIRLFRFFLTSINLSRKQKPLEWMRLVPVEKQEQGVPISPVTRGLRLYDTPYALGRPIFSFTIHDPGAYNLLFDIQGARSRIDIVPDYTSGREWIFVLSILCEICIVVMPTAVYFAYRYRLFRSRRKNQQQQHRVRADKFMDMVKKKGSSPS